MDAQARLAQYVEVWWSAIEDLLTLLEQLDDDEWSIPTDLAGWDVRAVASHVAHLESILAGCPEETAEVGEPEHVGGLMGLYTEIGVINRRQSTPGELIDEIRTVTIRRHEALAADPPVDPTASPVHVFGGVPWNWGTLLRNRPLDIWMHEQDIRRATNRPGNLDSPAADHTTDYLIESFGYVLAKKAGMPSGIRAVLEVASSEVVAYTVTDAHRGERLTSVPTDPDVHLRMDRETFLLLAGGRRAIGPETVKIDGDATLGEQILAAMATTP